MYMHGNMAPGLIPRHTDSARLSKAKHMLSAMKYSSNPNGLNVQERDYFITRHSQIRPIQVWLTLWLHDIFCSVFVQVSLVSAEPPHGQKWRLP